MFNMSKNEDIKKGVIFSIGENNPAFKPYFIGNSFLNMLVNDPDFECSVGNVTFEPGCRNNWHIHHKGWQILLVTGGEGWYQEEGISAQFLKPGDVVKIPEGVKHWHGATKDSWFSHLAISKGETEWLEPVTDDQYELVK
jgi:quercetin dioxygenase-like cupin family protein